MDYAELGALDSFERVWARVRGEAFSPETPREETSEGGEAALLRRLLGEKYPQQRLLGSLAARSRGRERDCLARLAREEGEQLRQLELSLFLLTGERYVFGGCRPGAEDRLSALRRAWIEEGRLAALLEAAASRLGDWGSTAVKGFARQDEAHAQTLRGLVARALGHWGQG